MSCLHKNTEHYPAGDVHPGSKAYTVCVDCGVDMDHLDD